MSRNTWSIYTYDGSSWNSDTAIYRPNEDLSIGVSSTQTKVNLLDGSSGFVAPSTKIRKEALNFTWNYLSNSMKSQIEGYITNHTKVKIVAHDATEFIGRFTSFQSIWLVGQDPDKYNYQATLELTE